MYSKQLEQWTDLGPTQCRLHIKSCVPFISDRAGTRVLFNFHLGSDYRLPPIVQSSLPNIVEILRTGSDS